MRPQGGASGTVRVADAAGFGAKAARLGTAGAAGLRVVCDWDRTLTRAFTDDGRDQTTYSLFFHGAYLGEAFNRESKALYDAYRWVERSSDVPEEEKRVRMRAWWEQQFGLMVRFGFCRRMIADAVARDALRMRPGFEAFFRVLARHGVPVLILSAGLKDVIDAFLAHRGLRTPNVFVVGNGFVFDVQGRATGFDRPLIHTLNKAESRVSIPGYEPASRRPNVLLLGDTLEDARMCEGQDCTLRIGFLNGHEASLETYCEAYDAVHVADEGLGFVNQLLQDVCGGSRRDGVDPGKRKDYIL